MTCCVPTRSTLPLLSQIVSCGASKLERDSLFCRSLAPKLRDETSRERLDLGTEVELTRLRTEITSEGSLTLSADTAEIKPMFSDGSGRQTELDVEPLSQIVHDLNERFGLNLDQRDQLLFDQFEETWVANPEIAAQARNNTLDNFRLVFDRTFLRTVVGRMDENEAIFKRILDDPEFQTALMDLYATRVYRRTRAANP